MESGFLIESILPEPTYLNNNTFNNNKLIKRYTQISLFIEWV